jgi:PilZ domain-containing protein
MLVARELRSEDREIYRGDVHLTLDESGQFAAELVDVSSNGFRVRHSDPRLQPGREVRFQHRIFAGRAKVLWTALVGGQTQSGFQILRG